MDYHRIYETQDEVKLSMIKILFNNHGIRYRVLFENSLQTGYVYALGNNGAIIEVASEDVRDAKELLTTLDINLDYNRKEDMFDFLKVFDKKTRNIPLLGSISVGFRFLISVSILSILIVGIFLLSLLKIGRNELIGNYFCVDEITYKGEKIELVSAMKIEFIGFPNICREYVEFRDNGIIIMPGLSHFQSNGLYEFNYNRKVLTISNVEENKEIYEGLYKVRTNWTGSIYFISNYTTIKLSQR